MTRTASTRARLGWRTRQARGWKPPRRVHPGDDFAREARERLGLTQTEMAEALGVSERTIIRIENGGQLRLMLRRAIELLLKDKRPR
jgi:ribosome-binding protein aMBF1 (putative translation factor)